MLTYIINVVDVQRALFARTMLITVYVLAHLILKIALRGNITIASLADEDPDTQRS